MEQYHIGAYWGPRKDPLADCTRHIYDFLTGLANIDAFFSQWKRQGRSRIDAMKKVVEISYDELYKLLSRGVNRTDVGRIVIESLGNNISLWDGTDEDTDHSISINCNVTSIRVKNSCLLDFPSDTGILARLLRPECSTEILELMIRCFTPDYAVVTSDKIRQIVEPSDITIGWISYYAADYLQVPLLPEIFQTRTVEGQGTLITAGNEPLTHENPEHVKRVEKLYALLTGK